MRSSHVLRITLFFLFVSQPAYAGQCTALLERVTSVFTREVRLAEDLPLHPVLSKAEDFDQFLKSNELQEEYFRYLQSLYGNKKFYRSQYDAIMKQLKDVTRAIPELKGRLWSGAGTGTLFSITGSLKTSGRSLDAAAWDSYFRASLSTYEKASGGLNNLNDSYRIKEMSRIFSRVDREKSELDLAMTKAKTKSEKSALTQDFFKRLKTDVEVQNVSNYIAYKKLNDGYTRDILSSDDPDLILDHMNALREQSKRSFQVDHLHVPDAIISQVRDLIPNKARLLERTDLFPVKTIRTNQGKIVPVGSSGVAEYQFVPVTRRLDGIFKGAPLGECVGGNCASLSSLTPERWATIALKNTELYQVMKDGEYLGFVQTIPAYGKSGKKFLSVDYGAPVLRNDILLKNSKGDLVRTPLHLAMNKVLAKRASKNGFSGITTSESIAINNAGVLIDVNNTALRLQKSETLQIERDPLIDKIIRWKKNQPTEADVITVYSGKMILDATENDHARLGLMNWEAVNLNKIRIEKLKPEAKDSLFRFLKHQKSWSDKTLEAVIGMQASSADIRELLFQYLESQKYWSDQTSNRVTRLFKDIQLEDKVALLGVIDRRRLWSESLGEDFWNEDIWKELILLAKYNDVGRNQVLQFIQFSGKGVKWPESFWDIVPELVVKSKSESDIMPKILAQQLEWPDTVWHQLPEWIKIYEPRLKESLIGDWSVALKREWPETFVKAVPELMLSEQAYVAGTIIQVLERFSEWPPEIWKVVPSVLNSPGKWNSYLMASALKNKKNWPAEVWKQFPALIQSEKNMKHVVPPPVAAALMNQPIWPDEVRQALQTKLKDYPDSPWLKELFQKHK